MRGWHELGLHEVDGALERWQLELPVGVEERRSCRRVAGCAAAAITRRASPNPHAGRAS